MLYFILACSDGRDFEGGMSIYVYIYGLLGATLGAGFHFQLHTYVYHIAENFCEHKFL